MNSHHLPRYDIKYLERQKKALQSKTRVYLSFWSVGHSPLQLFAY